MHKFMRFVRQNKKKIIKVALIVAFLFGCLQLLNYVAKSNENQIEIKSNDKSDIKNETNGAIVSDKSALSGGSVSTTEIKKVSSKIEEFVGYCNEHDVEKAYDMLSDSCKEELYPSQEYFEENYYNQLFEKGKKTYSIENWTGNTYIVKFKGDLLATGKSSDGFTYQDYITIDEKEKKLNINKYIGTEEINKSKTEDNIEITVISRAKYMDYEKYNIKIKNNTNGEILMDPVGSEASIYLKDTNDIKHKAINNEIIKEDLRVYEGHTNEITIKFDNPYISGRNIKTLTFSQIQTNYGKDFSGLNIKKISVNI